jgi:GNAT superfamily N-acetyltransferase
MKFRQAIRSDLPGIFCLYKDLNPDDPPLQPDKANIIWDIIEQNNLIRYFVATDNDTIVASCTIAIIPNLTRSGRPYAVIENVITKSEFRKQGIGRGIINTAVEFAKQNECYKVILLSSVKRTEAHEFYEAIGFDGKSKRGFELRLL